MRVIKGKARGWKPWCTFKAEMLDETSIQLLSTMLFSSRALSNLLSRQNEGGTVILG